VQYSYKGIQALLALNTGDFDLSEPLTVALTLHVVLTTAEFDDGDFVVTALSDHLGSDLGTFDDRSTDLHVVAVADQQNAVESDSFASSDFEFFNLQVFTFGNLVLLAAGYDNCVHLCISVDPAHPALK